MSVVDTFDFGVSQTVENAYGFCAEISVSDGDIYISDAVSSWERSKGVDMDYVTVTFSKGNSVVGFLSYVKRNGEEVSAYYRTRI